MLLQIIQAAVLRQAGEHLPVAGVVPINYQRTIHRLSGEEGVPFIKIGDAVKGILPVKVVGRIIHAAVLRLDHRIIDSGALDSHPAPHIAVSAVKGGELGQHSFRRALGEAGAAAVPIFVLDTVIGVSIDVGLQPEGISGQHRRCQQQYNGQQYAAFAEYFRLAVPFPRQDGCNPGTGTLFAGCFRDGCHRRWRGFPLFIRQGDENRAHRLSFAGFRAGLAGDGHAQSGFARPAGARSHGSGYRCADRAVLFQQFSRHSQDVPLHLPGISGDTAFKYGRSAGDLCNSAGEQPGGTGFGGGDFQPILSEQGDHGFLQAAGVHPVNVDAQPPADFLHHWGAHRLRCV